MLPLSAERIAQVCAGRLLHGSADTRAHRAEIDSRRVGAGSVFFAIVGPNDDGHRYLDAAVAAGATVLVVSRWSGALAELVGDAAVILVQDTTSALQQLGAHVRAVVDPLVVAITGSVGKTTTKELTYGLLRGSCPTHVAPGNLNNQWGLPLALLGLQPEHRWMVAELGMSHAGEIALLARLARPRVGVITKIAPVHMENFTSVEEVARAKEELALALPDDGALIVNADDPRTAAIGDRQRHRLRVVTFGRGAADVRAVGVRARDRGWSLTLVTPDGREPVQLVLPGTHSLDNFLAAAAVAHVLAIPPEQVAQRARALRLPRMRGQIHDTPAGVTVLDDSYNASPAAMISALEALATLPDTGRLVFVGGDMRELGSWSEEAHREVGLHAAQLGYALVVTVGVLARDIAHGARAGGLPEAATLSFSTADEAAEAVPDLLRPGDRVLVKGSRAVRMERVTEALLRVPQAASDRAEER